MTSLIRLFLLFSAALVTAALVAPTDLLHALKAEYAWVERAFTSVEALSLAVDMHHVLAFALLGFGARVAYPRASVGGPVAVLVVFAGATEAAQFLAPGRAPQLGDVLADVAGGLLGYGMAAAVMWPWRWGRVGDGGGRR